MQREDGRRFVQPFSDAAGQLATRYFVLYVGSTFDLISVVWILRRVTRSASQAAPPAEGLHATTPSVGAATRGTHVVPARPCPDAGAGLGVAAVVAKPDLHARL